MNNTSTDTSQKQILQNKLDATFALQGERARQSLLELEDRSKISRDIVMSQKNLRFLSMPDESGTTFRMGTLVLDGEGGDRRVIMDGTMHDNAIQQAATRMKVPSAYLLDLARPGNAPWKSELSSRILNDHIANAEEKNILARFVGNELRGVLSDRYRRMDMMQIFVSFWKASQQYGAKLYDGHCADLRSYLEVVLPQVYEVPVSHGIATHMAFGLQISSSDYGKGALDLREFSVQMVCLNGMVGRRLKREIHLGKRLDPSEFNYSDQTYNLDTQTQVSAVHDIVTQSLSTSRIQEQINEIRKDAGEEVSIKKALKVLPKMGMTLEEAEAVSEVFLEGRPEDGISGGPTLWKLKQAVSASAREYEPQRMREVQEIAGTLTAAPFR